MKDLIIIGASGCGRDAAWLVERINSIEPVWNVLGFIDDNDSIQGSVINGLEVIGKTSDILEYPEAHFICAVGVSSVRKRIINKITDLNPEIKFATLIDPSVLMSDTVTIGEGSIICAQTVMTVNISIGKHVVICIDCTIGHDAILCDYATLYPSVNVSGNCTVGHCAELGAGLQIIQGKKIGDYSVVGAGAVVVNDIPSKCTAVGSPARPIKYRE